MYSCPLKHYTYQGLGYNIHSITKEYLNSFTPELWRAYIPIKLNRKSISKECHLREIITVMQTHQLQLNLVMRKIISNRTVTPTITKILSLFPALSKDCMREKDPLHRQYTFSSAVLLNNAIAMTIIQLLEEHNIFFVLWIHLTQKQLMSKKYPYKVGLEK